MRLKKQGHSVYYCKYHLVFNTKYRRKVFRPAGVHEYFLKLLRRIRSHYPEIEIENCNHDMDHVHMVVSIPPKMSVSDVVRIIKCNTGKAMKEKYGYLQRLYWGTDGIWSEGYMVSTVGVNEEMIKLYVEEQGKEDLGQTLFE
ncbi:MAG: IS200/IS605 family transposase [Elusimicrobiota bacterium]|jgi:putative transposase|nr:IS200/IS605 family transposase [Elusimicrobiota bacterium]